MTQTEGWRAYRKILEHHLQAKRNEFETVADSSHDGIAQILKSENNKGAIMGLRLALSIPEGIFNNDKILRSSLGLPAGGDEYDDSDA
jgi:hypothetical protein